MAFVIVCLILVSCEQPFVNQERKYNEYGDLVKYSYLFHGPEGDLNIKTTRIYSYEYNEDHLWTKCEMKENGSLTYLCYRSFDEFGRTIRFTFYYMSSFKPYEGYDPSENEDRNLDLDDGLVHLLYYSRDFLFDYYPGPAAEKDPMKDFFSDGAFTSLGEDAYYDSPFFSEVQRHRSFDHLEGLEMEVQWEKYGEKKVTTFYAKDYEDGTYDHTVWEFSEDGNLIHEEWDVYYSEEDFRTGEKDYVFSENKDQYVLNYHHSLAGYRDGASFEETDEYSPDGELLKKTQHSKNSEGAVLHLEITYNSFTDDDNNVGTYYRYDLDPNGNKVYEGTGPWLNGDYGDH